MCTGDTRAHGLQASESGVCCEAIRDRDSAIVADLISAEAASDNMSWSTAFVAVSLRCHSREVPQPHVNPESRTDSSSACIFNLVVGHAGTGHGFRR